MSANMKEIKGRIDSVKNTRQITKAMDIVSSTKFKKYQKLTLKSRAYSNAIDETFSNIISNSNEIKHVLFAGKKEVKKVGIIVMTSDRGLCGSFNSSTLKELEKCITQLSREGKEVSVIAIGKKTIDYCRRKGISIDSEYTQLIQETIFEKAKNISEEIVNLYMDDVYDEVRLIYSKFISAINYELKNEKLLPMEVVESNKTREYIFEPSVESLLESFIPRRLNIKLYQSILENTASEHSARMTAMKNASDNAVDMIDKLTLEYNRVRQAIITQELSEIVGGSEALK